MPQVKDYTFVADPLGQAFAFNLAKNEHRALPRDLYKGRVIDYLESRETMEKDWEIGMRKDESFKRPGSVPFKWEIQPGVPKPHIQSPTSSPWKSKLSPPPSRTPPSQSPRIFASPWRPELSPLPYGSSPSPFQSPFESPTAARSASASPSKRRGHQLFQSKLHALPHAVAVASQGCFPIPPSRRKEDKKSIGGRGIEMIFPSRQRSMPSRSSPSFTSPFRKSSWARDEVEVAARWLF